MLCANSLGTGDGSKTEEFSESSKGGEGGGAGSFSIQKFVLQILDLQAGLFEHEV